MRKATLPAVPTRERGKFSRPQPRRFLPPPTPRRSEHPAATRSPRDTPRHPYLRTGGRGARPRRRRRAAQGGLGAGTALRAAAAPRAGQQRGQQQRQQRGQHAGNTAPRSAARGRGTRPVPPAPPWGVLGPRRPARPQPDPRWGDSAVLSVGGGCRSDAVPSGGVHWPASGVCPLRNRREVPRGARLVKFAGGTKL